MKHWVKILGYFGVVTEVRLLKSVIWGCQCYWICGTLQVLQCGNSGEVKEQCGVWLSVLLDMWNIASTSV